MQSSLSDGRPQDVIPGRIAWTALVLLTLANVLNYLDRTLIAALSGPIKAEFALSDTELGLLSGFAFVLLYATFGLPIARLADRVSRKGVLVVSLSVWCGFTAACGLAQNFTQLVLSRIGIGIGEAGCLPAAHSLLSDYFPVKRRTMALGIFTAGNMVGITLALTLGAWLGARVGWRTTFLVLGIPGILLALLIWALVREPTRAGAGTAQPLAFWPALGALGANRPVLWLVLATGVNAFITYGMTQWLPQFFARCHGYTLSQLGVSFGLMFGTGLTLGVLAGGWAGDRLTRRSADAPLLLCLGSVLLTGGTYVAVLLVPSANLAVGLTFVAAAFNGLATPQMVTMIQNESPVRLRATASSLSAISGSVIGVGGGPAVIGMLSDALTPAFGTGAIRVALLASLGMCVVAAGVYYFAAAAVRRARITAGSPPPEAAFQQPGPAATLGG